MKTLLNQLKFLWLYRPLVLNEIFKSCGRFFKDSVMGKYLFIVAILILLLILTGCATGSDGRFVGAGGGSYEYKRTLADNSTCEVSVVSGRDITGGVLTIDKDCTVTSKADTTQGAVQSLQVISDTVKVIGAAVSKIP